MSGYDIGLSGLNAAQQALNIIGNNMANAATEGYHRQRVELSPAYGALYGYMFMGGGVNVEAVTRLVDNLLERQILDEQSLLEHVQQEYNTLLTVEAAFGEFSESGGLSAAIDDFFGSLQDLCTHPDELTWQQQVVDSAETMAGRIRTLGSFLDNLKNEMTFECQNVVEQINTLAERIAELNGNIERIEIDGTTATSLRDQRDHCISELSELITIETVSRDYGTVDVNVEGIPLVSGTNFMAIGVGLNEDGRTGIGVAGTNSYDREIYGGKLGGLLSLKNDLIDEIESKLNDMAAALISQINQVHIQGVGSFGSFNELAGWTMNSENLSEFEPPITDGKIYIRITDTATGQVTREEIDVDVSTDTLAAIAAKISAIDGLDASVASSQIRIRAESGYKFDFSPAVLAQPTDSNLTSATPPDISVTGIYTGDTNQTFTCEVIEDGLIGNGSLQVEVRNSSGELVRTINLGEGYVAGDYIDLADGIRISLGQGELITGDTFEIKAFSNTDTSGFVSATGLNCFFAGSDASDIRVFEQIQNNPSRLATSAGPEMNDNTNALQMYALRDNPLSSLNDMTVSQFYNQLVTDVGQDVSIRQMNTESMEVIVADLINRQSEISGVNINDEAVQLILFEQMFAAIAKYINTVQSALSTIMEIL